MSLWTVPELLYASTHVGIAKNTFTTEVTINDTATMGIQAKLPANFWAANNWQPGRTIRITARGILSSTGTPTYTPTIRLGTSGSIAGPIILGSPTALTTGSGVTNQFFEIMGDVTMITIAPAGANSTLQGVGRIICPGLATSIAPLYGGALSPGSVATVDSSVDNFVNVNVACSASAAANTITLQQLLVEALN